MLRCILATSNRRYFQCLLNAKKKEIDELGVKIEDLSTQVLLQEETKLNVTKELQYWQQKASVLEVCIPSIPMVANARVPLIKLFIS